MPIQFLSFTAAAEALDRHPSGIRRNAAAGKILVLGEPGDQKVVVANGELVETAEQLQSLILSVSQQAVDAERRAVAAEQAAQAAGDQLEVLRIEFGEYRARSTAQLRALVEAQTANVAAQAANARAIAELVPEA